MDKRTLFFVGGASAFLTTLIFSSADSLEEREAAYGY